LVIVPNYTGDRLTFGLGMERAKAEGLKLESVTVGEDCATNSRDKSAGRRGLCGMFLTIKVPNINYTGARLHEKLAKMLV